MNKQAGTILATERDHAIYEAGFEAGMKERDALQARVAELEADAGRYRWLTDDHAKMASRELVDHISSSISVRGKGAIDAAIDAAKAEEVKQC